MKKYFGLFVLTLAIISSSFLFSQGKKPFTFDDVMKFKSIRYATISDYGEWIGYSAVPDRGNPTAFFHDLSDSTNIKKIDRGIKPDISPNAMWGAAIVNPDVIEEANAKSDKPDDGLKIIGLKKEKEYNYEGISKFEFTNDSKWIVITKKTDKNAYKGDNLKKKPNGSELILKHLNSGTDIKMDYVSDYHIDSTSKYLFYAVSDPKGKIDGIYYRALNEEFAPEYIIDTTENNYFGNISWNLDKEILAYSKGKLMDDGEPDSLSVKLWNSNDNLVKEIIEPSMINEDWYLPSKNKFEWSEDGERMFLGIKPDWERDTTDSDDFKYNDSTFYDIDAILSQKDLLLWHWDDDRISTNQVKWWQENKDRTYLCVYHLEDEKFVQLSDEDLDYVVAADNPKYTIGYDTKPYLKEITWNGWFHDVYKVNIQTGEKQLIEKRLMERAHISPLGNFVAFFNDSNWYVYDTNKDSAANVTLKAKRINFYDENWDVPQQAPSYGFGGWYAKEEGFIVYDEFDMWAFGSSNLAYNNLTYASGRQHKYRVRIVHLDKNKKYWSYGDTIYTMCYYKEKRHQTLTRTEIGVAGSEILKREEGKKFTWVGKAEHADVFIFTRESFDEFPDIWVTDDITFENVRKVTDVNPQMKEHKWGYTEPFEFPTINKDMLKGYIIKPDDFDPNKKYPLLVYFYEQFAERTYSFYQPRMNHRPNYQTYLSDGYLIIVPDIKYYRGRPGYDATDAIVGATRYIADQGFIDTTKMVLQGHSWGAYQGAFIITQTDMFAASCVGAPVGNMTSAYSGIRLGTGLARQFQYEMYQSRIGGTLWDSLDNYLNNSPVILADKINTPLLIMHGDIDEAVPWEQGIEMFLALRRLQKPSWLLQYVKEPHHPRKYPNKVDWAYKMKEFFDHYALGKPAPKWMTEGEPWWGE